MRMFVFVALGLVLTSGARGVDSGPREAPSQLEAAERLLLAGPQEKILMSQTGSWDVTATLWSTVNAQPMVTKGLIAERKMIGNYLEEIIRPAPGSKTPDFRRIDYLNFDRVEARWKYVSMDTRFPVSIMPAAGSGLSGGEWPIQLQFAPQGFVGFGPETAGRFMISNMVISTADPNHSVKEQHVNMADGSGVTWLFTRYEYARRP